MNFSEIVPHSSVVSFSPNGEFLASTKGAKLSIFSTTHLNLVATFSTVDQTTQLEWSDDSEYLLSVQPRKSVVQAFAVQDQQWTAKISLGLSGLSYARWTPDARQVITITEFQLRLTVWSLVDKSVSHIRNPKHIDHGIAFSNDGKFMALAERSECKDYIGVYFTQNWQLINVIITQHFLVDTLDLQDILWTPDDTALVVWDNPLECRILVYSPIGTLIGRQLPYSNALGVKCVTLSPNGLFLTAGLYDQSLRVYNHITWRQIIEFQHVTNVTGNVQIYREEEYTEPTTHGEEPHTTSRYGMLETPLRLASLKVPTDKPNPTLGVSLCVWSPDSRYIATRNGVFYLDNMPTVLWLWDMTSLSLSVIMTHLQPIKSIAWSPRSLHLAICTGTSRIFLWSEEGGSVCEIPFGRDHIEAKDFTVQKVKWNASGQALLLMDKSVLMIAYPQFE